MTETRKYDAVIVGCGQAGNPLSTALAGAGWKVALVEKDKVGGTCVNYGCTPSKTLIASARVAHLVRRSEDFGVRVERAWVDMERIRERKRSVVKSFREGSLARIKDTDGLDFIRGEARFTGERELEVEDSGGGDTATLTADKVFLDVGSRPAVPPIEGLDKTPHFNSETVMEVDAVPEDLVIIGGGYIGVEFAQLFSRLGSRVTVLQRGRRLLENEDEEVSGAVADFLSDEGVRLAFDTETKLVEKTSDGVRIKAETPDGERAYEGSHLLVAVGRTPNTDFLNLDAAGVEAGDDGFIRVNHRLETTADGVYALGEAAGSPAFTHVVYDDFRVVRSSVLDGTEATTEARVLPYTVYTDPQLGRIGLTEREAREKGFSFTVAKTPMAYVARAVETGETAGFMKALVEEKTGRILGAAVLGPEGGEVASMIQIAMMGGLTAGDLAGGVFSHPTLAESLNTLFSS